MKRESLAPAEPAIINQNRISDQVYEYLRDEIMTGRLAPGARLDLDELVERLKVSRMPIKEAISRLDAEGLLEIQARRGVYVRNLDPVELAETLEVRCALEVLAGKLAVQRITKADLENLRALIAGMEKTTARTEVGAHLAQNTDFHELIMKIAGNGRLLEIYRRVRIPLQVAGIHYQTQNWTDRIAREQREHRAIVRALEQRDEAAVERAITSHIKRAMASLITDVEAAAKNG
ncbi:MAG: GntR family transcriptional regulator [Blastocatellia bacterium]